jgi:phage tail-like protein
MSRVDPFFGFNFLFTIQGISQIAFHEAKVGAFTIASVDYREGNELANHVRKLHAMPAYAVVTANRGVTPNLDLWNWFSRLMSGIDDRRDGSVTLLDELHVPQVIWAMKSCFVSKLEGPSFNATANNIAIESLELTVEEVSLSLP